MPAETILVIDDNAVNLKLARAVLGHAGYDVRTAVDGVTAFASLDEVRPDLVITDLQLPDITGFDLVKKLKQDARFTHIPVIAMTASGIPRDEELAREAGCDSYLAKPFEIEVLTHLVARHLRAR